MLKKTFWLLCLFLTISTVTIAQTDTTYWRRSLSAGANVNQSSFSSNWKAGGVNSIALGLFLNGKANYRQGLVSWDNEIQLQYGIINAAGQGVRKTTDIIFLDSKYGYALGDNWNLFVSGNFISQFTRGFNYGADAAGNDLLISNFMSPGFLTFATGMEYKPVDWFSLRLSPFAPRFTFLTDPTVGLTERYGVPVGQTVRTEWLAALVQMDLNKDIATNVNLKVSYQGYANFETLALNAIDHRLITTLTAKINRFMSVNLTGNLLYDLDQDRAVQYSQALALGILFNTQNFTD